MDYFAMRSLAYKLSNGVKIEDRSYFFRRYNKTFLGSDAVTWLCGWLQANGRPCNRTAAQEVGNKLLKAGFFSHCTGQHKFKDEHLFYRFDMEKVRDDKGPRMEKDSKIALMHIPQEFGGGIFKIPVGDGTTVHSLLEQTLDDLHRIRLDVSPAGCVTFEVKDFALSTKDIPEDEDVKKEDVLPDPVPILTTAAIKKKDDQVELWLINLSGREPCRWITTTSKDGKKKELGPPPKDPWGDVIVLDLNEEKKKLSDHWSSKKACVVLIRRFG